jgi:flagellar biosynthesis component FlhA
MTSECPLVLHVAPYAVPAACAELEAFPIERALFDALGLLVPPAAVRADPLLPRGWFAVTIAGRRVTDEPGDAAVACRRLHTLARHHAAELIDARSAQALLDLLHDLEPVLVEAVEATFDAAYLARRLRALLAEGVPVLDLRAILEALLRHRALAPPDAPEEDYDDDVRLALQHTITAPLRRGGTLTVHLADAAPLTEDVRAALHAAVARAAAEDQAVHRPTVLLTRRDRRRAVRDALAGHESAVTVLAYDDLPPDLAIEVATPVAG